MAKSCYICGVTDKPLTADHVIPKVLFPTPRPSNLITEDACEECNNRFSKDDSLLAVYLSAALGGNEAAKWVWENKAVKGILARSRALATQLVTDATKKEVLTELGVAEIDVLRIPEERLERILFRIAKGLIRHLDPAFDYANLQFTLQRLWPNKESFDLIQEYAAKMRYIERGNAVFRCLYGFTPAEHRGAAFILIFYGAVGFMVHGQPAA
jgi:hypothetical protein